ncbi:hypothetical protein WN943_025373 [Citrus x changshan-huyou]
MCCFYLNVGISYQEKEEVCVLLRQVSVVQIFVLFIMELKSILVALILFYQIVWDVASWVAKLCCLEDCVIDFTM